MRNAEDNPTLRLLHAHSSVNLQAYSLLNKDVRPFPRQILEGLGFGFK